MMTFAHRLLAAALCSFGLGCSATPASAPVKRASHERTTSPAPAPMAAPAPVATPAEAPPTPTADCSESDPADTCKRACDAGFIPSCLRFGRLRLLPVPGPYDPREAGAAFEKACNANEAAACDRLGMMTEGDELECDYPRAASHALR